MLGTTLAMTIAIALLAAALLDGAAAFARAGVHAAAEHAVEGATRDALADYQNALGAAIANANAADAASGYAGAIATLANPYSHAAANGSTGSPATAFAVAYDVVPTTVSAPACGAPGATANAPDAIGWLQCGGGIAESRMSLHVTARVLDPNGAVLAQREQYVTLRLFAQPPYSAVDGAKDGDAASVATGTTASPAHEGDAGGDTISGAPSPSTAASPWPAGGTLIHVRYECHDGAGSCANAAPPDPDASGLHAGVRWQNGNAPAP